MTNRMDWAAVGRYSLRLSWALVVLIAKLALIALSIAIALFDAGERNQDDDSEYLGKLGDIGIDSDGNETYADTDFKL
jgi:hypothetical protein